MDEKELLSFAKGAGLGSLGLAFSSAMSYVINVLVTRFVGPSAYGVFHLANTLFTIATLCAVFGLDQAVIRFTSDPESMGDSGTLKETIRSATIFVLALSIIIFICTCGFIPWLSVTELKGMASLDLAVIVLFASLPAASIAAIFSSTLRGLKKIGKYSLAVNVLQPISRFLIILVLLLLGLKLRAVVLGTALATLVGLAISYQFMSSSLLAGGASRWTFVPRRMLKFSTPVFFDALLNLLIPAVPALFLAHYAQASDVGIYGVAVKIGLMVSFVLNGYNIAFAPTIADLYGKGKKDSLEWLFKTITKWMFTVGFFVFLTILLFGSTLLAIFGKGFAVGKPLVPMIAFAELINVAVGSVGYILIMTGRPALNLVNSAIALVFCIISSALAIPRLGSFGAGLAYIVGVGIVNLLRLLEVYLVEGIHPYRLTYLKPLVAGGIAFGLVRMLEKGIVHIGSQMYHAAVFALFGFLFFSVLMLLKFDNEDVIVLRAISMRLGLRVGD